jgi:transposase
VARVIIGVDPHKRSATMEVIDGREKVLGEGRYGTDSDGYRTMLAAGRRYPKRMWAVEGCNGIGRHVAQRLVADGEIVVDVPAKLSARARVFATGQGRKTDPVDAHCVAVVALRTKGLRQVTVDDATVALRLMVDRRDWLGRARTDTVNRLHALLLDLVAGGAKKHLTAPQARTILAGVRPRDVVGRTRRQLAAELITELAVIDKKIKLADQALNELIAATGSRLQQLHGIGPSNAARLLGDIGDITRFASRNHFASWNGTAPLDASSGDQQRHRLSRAGNRRINRALHIMAVVQLRHDTEGRRYFRRKLAAGKTPMEAMRCLKRRLSDVVYRQMLADVKASPGGQSGASLTSSAADPTPMVDSSDKPQPGLNREPTPPAVDARSRTGDSRRGVPTAANPDGQTKASHHRLHNPDQRFNHHPCPAEEEIFAQGLTERGARCGRLS